MPTGLLDGTLNVRRRPAGALIALLAALAMSGCGDSGSSGSGSATNGTSAASGLDTTATAATGGSSASSVPGATQTISGTISNSGSTSTTSTGNTSSTTSATSGATVASTPATNVERAATLSWSPPQQNTDGSQLTDLAGYRVYTGTDPSSLKMVADLAWAGYLWVQLNDLVPGTWYFSIRSYNSAGVESDFAPLVSKSVS